jgi:pimeloyl-ACP methyl ester carboxylesterase
MSMNKLGQWLGDVSLRRAVRATRDVLQPSRREAIKDITASLGEVRAKTSLDWLDDPAREHAKLTDVIGPYTPLVAPHRQLDRVYDGYFVGAGGSIYPPTVSLSDIPAVQPNNGKPATTTIIAINGIMTDVALQSADMQALANTGARVIGLHNATAGLVKDVGQCIADKLGARDNAAVTTLAKLLHTGLSEGQEFHVVGHSQGALVLACALSDAKEQFLLDGLTEPQVKDMLSRITVETFAGAATRYTDGPSYIHYINQFDAIPMVAGVGMTSNPFSTPGTGAIMRVFREAHTPDRLPPISDGLSNYFARVVDRSVHGPQDVYFRHRS